MISLWKTRAGAQCQLDVLSVIVYWFITISMYVHCDFKTFIVQINKNIFEFEHKQKIISNGQLPFTSLKNLNKSIIKKMRGYE